MHGIPGVHIECKRVERLMRDRGIQARRKKRFRHATDSKHANPIARYPGTPGRIRGWLLAVAIGLGLALASVHWWTT